jgi:hypothetical protein
MSYLLYAVAIFLRMPFPDFLFLNQWRRKARVRQQQLLPGARKRRRSRRSRLQLQQQSLNRGRPRSVQPLNLPIHISCRGSRSTARDGDRVSRHRLTPTEAAEPNREKKRAGKRTWKKRAAARAAAAVSAAAVAIESPSMQTSEKQIVDFQHSYSVDAAPLCKMTNMQAVLDQLIILTGWLIRVATQLRTVG